MRSAIFLGLSIFLWVMTRDFFPETDNVYQHFLGYRLWQKEALPLLSQKMSMLKEEGGAILDLARFREQMAGVYPLPNTLFYLFNRFLRLFGIEPYSKFMAHAIFWSVIGVWALAFAVVLLCFQRLKEFHLPLLVTLLFLFLSEAAPWRFVSDAYTHSFFLPHRDDLVFGFTPRNFFTLLSLAIFALRWSGRTRESYGLLLGGTLIHTTYAFLLFFTLFPLDCFFHRKVFADRWVAGFAIVTALFLLGLEPFVASRTWWLKGLILMMVVVPCFFPVGRERPVQELYILLFLSLFCAIPWSFSWKTGSSPMEGSAISPLLLDRYRFLIRGGLILALAQRYPGWGAKWLPRASMVLALATLLWTVPKIKPTVRQMIYHFDHTYDAKSGSLILREADDEGRVYYLLMKTMDFNAAGIPN